MQPSKQPQATRQRTRYAEDEAYRELRRQRARDYYAKHREDICRKTYMKLVDRGAIANPRQLERYANK